MTTDLRAMLGERVVASLIQQIEASIAAAQVKPGEEEIERDRLQVPPQIPGIPARRFLLWAVQREVERAHQGRDAAGETLNSPSRKTELHHNLVASLQQRAVPKYTALESLRRQLEEQEARAGDEEDEAQSTHFGSRCALLRAIEPEPTPPDTRAVLDLRAAAGSWNSEDGSLSRE